MRKLASIQKIKEIQKHPNADKLEIVVFEDIAWKCIVQKDQYSPGEKVVYFEIDSVLPFEKRYQFLEKCCKIDNDLFQGYRIRTIKLRGIVSQGIVFKIEDFKDHPEYEKIKNSDIGADLTEILNIQKYEIPAKFESGEIIGEFPFFIPKTDEERIQNHPEYFKESAYRNVPYECSLKLDGTSMTIWKDGVCSRNYQLNTEQDTPYTKFYKKMKESGVFEKLEKEDINLAFQGELMGPGIQKNPEKFKKHIWYIFNIFDIDEQRYLTPEERYTIYNRYIDSVSDIYHVPILKVRAFPFQKYKSVEEIVNTFDGIPSINAKYGEGVVFKPLDPIYPSFKVISNTFLLNGGY